MTYSYTQISAFLSCPRRYRYQYLEGWQEKETRASLLFGRAFEQALSAYFLGLDYQARWAQEWSTLRGMEVTYGASERWEEMLEQGQELLRLFSEQKRVQVADPRQHLQIKCLKRLDKRNDFLGFIDTIATIGDKRCVIDWKTSGSCYAAQPSGVVALDPQLTCYSWLTGIAEVALVVFVRKRTPEIQYLTATVTDDQRADFARLVEETVRQIEAAQFHPHSGIRFPQNQCLSCAFLPLCLKNAEQAQLRLARRNGVDLGWLDELGY